MRNLKNSRTLSFLALALIYLCAGALGFLLYSVLSFDDWLNMSRSNYWFLGWSTNKNAMAATYKSGDKLSVTKDTVLYAVWKLNGYMLTFDANGGSNPPAKITAAKGATVTIPKSSVTRDGYWFLGWATSKIAATAQYKSNDTLKLSANTTLYAVWKKK